MPTCGESRHDSRESTLATCIAAKARFDLAHDEQVPARRALRHLLAQLPSALVIELSQAPGGYIVVGPGPSGYDPETLALGCETLRAVALMGLDDLVAVRRPALETLAGLLDHLLGSRLESGGGTISGGSIAAPGWADFHRRLLAAFALGYADEEPARATPTAYFTWAFSRYCQGHQELAGADPLAHRLLRSTLFSEAFWRGHPLSESRQPS